MKLNLGCGSCFSPGWINLDLRPGDPAIQNHDLRNPLPFSGESCSAIYCSHVLEHLTREDASALIGECSRVLRAGAIIRVAVPDLETIAGLYLDSVRLATSGSPAALERHEWATMELIDQMVREQSGGNMLPFLDHRMLIEPYVLTRLGPEAVTAINHMRKNGIGPRKPANPGERHLWMYDRVSLSRVLSSSGFRNIVVAAAGESDIPGFADSTLEIDETGCVRKPDSLFMEAVR